MKRRDFIKTTAAASVSILSAKTAFGATANEKLRLGVIGCGGRGPWIGDLFEKNTNTKVVAVHDYFQDRVERAGKKFSIGKENQFIGLGGYHKLLASGVDAVAIISPPYFHPDQAIAAIEAGKHVYLAKPVAVDVPGCMNIVAAADKVVGKQSVLVDFQTRNNEFFRGAAQRIHEGMLGDPVLGQCFYYAGRLGKQSKRDDDVGRLRNWVFDIALSGDIIVEQNIHVLDVMNWYLQGHPVSAVGAGGRKARVDVGDCNDHFALQYSYPNDVIVDFSSAQFTHGISDLCIRLMGSEGTVDSHYGGDVSIRGRKEGWKGGNTGTIYQQGAVNNMIDFCASIQTGEYLNNALEAAHSTMTSILGRTAAQTGEKVTWDEMVTANEVLDAKLDLPDDGPELVG